MTRQERRTLGSRSGRRSCTKVKLAKNCRPKPRVQILLRRSEKATEAEHAAGAKRRQKKLLKSTFPGLGKLILSNSGLTRALEHMEGQAHRKQKAHGGSEEERMVLKRSAERAKESFVDAVQRRLAHGESIVALFKALSRF